MNDHFTYLPLPEGHIRVFQIKRDSDETIYELRGALLDENLRFRAISYVWGSPARTHNLICNGMNLAVTSSVFELLSSAVISGFGEEAPIWIDFLCINQDNEDEQTHQVRNMDFIYSRAEEVIVWLGVASFDSDLAMDTIRALSEKKALISGENREEFVSGKETLNKAGLANVSEKVRYALVSLFSRQWFRRLWVFQEVVLARTRQVVCGSRIIPWDDFADASIAMVRLRSHQFSLTIPNFGSALPGQQATLEMGLIARAVNAKAEIRASYLVDVAQRKAVTNPRDKVYGILGIASPHIRENVEVDCSQKGRSALLRLYIDCGKACIEEEPSLYLLYMLSGAEKNPDLPSWCPDLDAPSSRVILMNPAWRAGVKTTTEEEETYPGAWFEPDCDDLSTIGCRVDIVAQVVDSTFCWQSIDEDAEAPSVEDAARNLVWQSECLELLKETSNEQDEIPMSYIYTLWEGDYGDSEQSSLIREAYERTMAIWRNAKQSIPPDDADPSVRAVAYHMHTHLLRNCRGRKFFTTQSGRFGIGPPDTQAGDEVYILYGAGSLYLLRCDEDAVRILGNVYIHELMNLDETPDEIKEEDEIVRIS